MSQSSSILAGMLASKEFCIRMGAVTWCTTQFKLKPRGGAGRSDAVSQSLNIPQGHMTGESTTMCTYTAVKGSYTCCYFLFIVSLTDRM